MFSDSIPLDIFYITVSVALAVLAFDHSGGSIFILLATLLTAIAAITAWSIWLDHFLDRWHSTFDIILDLDEFDIP